MASLVLRFRLKLFSGMQECCWHTNIKTFKRINIQKEIFVFRGVPACCKDFRCFLVILPPGKGPSKPAKKQHGRFTHFFVKRPCSESTEGCCYNVRTIGISGKAIRNLQFSLVGGTWIKSKYAQLPFLRQHRTKPNWVLQVWFAFFCKSAYAGLSK